MTETKSVNPGTVKVMPSSAPLTVAAQKQLLFNSALRARALATIVDRGFEATTVDDLAAATGISRRTFFRYFATKEDVVIDAFNEFERRILDHVMDAPDATPSLDVVRAALLVACADPAREASGRQLYGLVNEVPSLRARLLDRRDWLRTRLANALTRSRRERARANLVASVSLALLDEAYRRWVDDATLTLPKAIADVFDALPALTAGRPPRAATGKRARRRPTSSRT